MVDYKFHKIDVGLPFLCVSTYTITSGERWRLEQEPKLRLSETIDVFSNGCVCCARPAYKLDGMFGGCWWF